MASDESVGELSGKGFGTQHDRATTAWAPRSIRDRRMFGRWPPQGGRRRYLWVALIALLTTAATVFLESTPIRRETPHAVTWLLCTLLVLLAACALYDAYRLTGEPALGWLTSALMTVASLELPFAVLIVAGEPGRFGPYDDKIHLIVGLGIVAMLVLAHRGVGLPDALDPLMLGALLGSGAALECLVRRKIVLDVPAIDSPVVEVAVVAAHALIGLVVLVLLVLLPGVRWVHRLRLGTAVLLLLTAYAAYLWDSSALSAGQVASLAQAILGTLVLLTTGLAVLHEAMSAQGHASDDLNRRAARAEIALQRDEERFHEVRATLAGVEATSHLLLDPAHDLSREQRRHLGELLDRELARLQRITLGTSTWTAEPFDVDDALAPLVAAQLAQGTDVHWHPSGAVLPWDRDEFAEIVSVMLTNAARHAAGSRVEVSVLTGTDFLDVLVRDHGPGVPSHLRHQIFERGIRRPDSPGQGIGLAGARRLAESHGGSLLLDLTRPGAGACFVARFPIHQIKGF